MNDRRFIIFAVAVLAALFAIAGLNFWQSQQHATGPKLISYSQFLDDLDRGKVKSVNIAGQSVLGTLTDRSYFSTTTANDPDLIRQLRAHNVAITAEETPQAGAFSWQGSLISLLPMLLFIVVAIYFFNRQSGMANRGLNLGKSKA